MKPLLMILLFTLCITSVEWGLFECLVSDGLKKRMKRNEVFFRTRENGIAVVSVATGNSRCTGFQKPMKSLFTKERRKRSNHFDGRTSW